jgi:hypothetical protein
MVKQIEIFSPYDPNIQDIIKGSKIENGRPSTKMQEAINKRKFYQTELLDMKNPSEYRFAVELLFHSTMPKECNPHLNFLYYKEFGPHEKFKEAEKDLELFWEWEKKIGKQLEKELENSPKDVKKLRKYFYFNSLEYYVEITRTVA